MFYKLHLSQYRLLLVKLFNKDNMFLDDLYPILNKYLKKNIICKNIDCLHINQYFESNGVSGEKYCSPCSDIKRISKNINNINWTLEGFIIKQGAFNTYAEKNIFKGEKIPSVIFGIFENIDSDIWDRWLNRIIFIGKKSSIIIDKRDKHKIIKLSDLSFNLNKGIRIKLSEIFNPHKSFDFKRFGDINNIIIQVILN
jgi:hypothetical protein